MANEEQLAILRQGVSAWNGWRKEHPQEMIDLSEVGLEGADLSGADLSWAHLSGALLSEAHLSRAYLGGAYLSGTDLSRAHLNGAYLSRARLSGADLNNAILNAANLSGAYLSKTNLSEADLREGDLTGAEFHGTILGSTNLAAAKGLDRCNHIGPSTIDHHTLAKSGTLPLTFLRGCGLPDALIDYFPSLLNEPVQFYSCFISYSHKNEAFAQRLHADLQNKDVRCWYAPHEMKIGAKLWDTVDTAIRVHDKVLLILSRHSINSEWVEDEVNKAFAEERRRKQTVLFPIRIDQTMMKTEEPWAVKLRDNRNIGDFSRWKNHEGYQKAFERLLRDLKADAMKTST